MFNNLKEEKKPVSFVQVKRQMSRSWKFTHDDPDFWPMIISVLRVMCLTPVGSSEEKERDGRGVGPEGN